MPGQERTISRYRGREGGIKKRRVGIRDDLNLISQSAGFVKRSCKLSIIKILSCTPPLLPFLVPSSPTMRAAYAWLVADIVLVV
jgi:hypothetical protein